MVKSTELLDLVRVSTIPSFGRSRLSEVFEVSEPRLSLGEEPRLRAGDEGVLLRPNPNKPTPLFFLDDSRLAPDFLTFFELEAFCFVSRNNSALGERLWAGLGIIVRVRSASLLLERGGPVLPGVKCAGEDGRVCDVEESGVR